MLENLCRLTIGELVALIVIIVFISAIVQIFLDKIVGPKIKGESYRSELEPLVTKLVRVAAPKLVTRDHFTKEDVENIIGRDENLDTEMYYRFKELMRTGKLSEEKLMKAME